MQQTRERDMKWYAAHLVIYVKFKKHRQNRYPLWENIVLIKANSEDEAMAKAKRRGHSEEGDCNGTFTWGGKPARWVFAGVRQLIVCVDPENRPNDGTEITHLELEVASKNQLDRLLEGGPASVKFLEMSRHDYSKD
jgi:hypothetical protein